MFLSLLILAAPPDPAFVVRPADATAQVGFVVKPAANPAGEKYDPYRYDSYSEFRDMLRRPSGWGVLFVGVPDTAVGTYAPHCRVKSGSLAGIGDGVYDCRFDPTTGEPRMTRRPAPGVPAAAPFAGPVAGSTPTTAATPAATSPRPAPAPGSFGATTPTARTLMRAPFAGTFGGTSGCTPFG